MSIATVDLRAAGFGSLLDAGDALLADISKLTAKGSQITVSDVQAIGAGVSGLVSQATAAVGQVAANPNGLAVVAVDDVVAYLTSIATAALKAKTSSAGVAGLAVSELTSLGSSFEAWVSSELANIKL